MKIKIDTDNKKIVLCEEISIDELSLLLSSMEEVVDIKEYKISYEPMVVKEYITIKDNNPWIQPNNPWQTQPFPGTIPLTYCDYKVKSPLSPGYIDQKNCFLYEITNNK